MAPTLASLNWQHHLPPSYNNAVTHSGLGGPLEFTARFSPHQIYIAQALALAAASISVASSVVTFYWFLKMKRNFRHHLVMLLILSDLLKAVWFVIGPTVVFIYGPLRSSSAYCQASGFFLALAIEASDMAIIMIAINTASFIFSPATSLGQGGLYRYRCYAYILWVVFPLVMASLPFVNPKGAFISQGGFCYIQVRPFWYRLVLSWIPRYLIFFSIICIYIVIYIYVHFQFRGFMADNAHSHKSRGTWLQEGKKQQDDTIDLVHRRDQRSPPPTPKLVRHGLLPSSEEGSIGTLESRRQSAISASVHDTDNATHPTIRRPDPIVAPTPASRGSFILNASTPALRPAKEGPQPSGIPSEVNDRSASISPDSSHTKDSRSVINFLQALKHPSPAQLRNRTPTPPPEPLTAVTLVDFLDGPDLGPDLANEQLRKRRQHVQRQLKFLFIYPIVYMLMWMVPFASHCLQYSDYYASHPYFALSSSVTVIIALQCAVDCLLFSSWETPWKYIPGSKGTFWDSFLFWRHGARGRDGTDRLAQTPTAPAGGGAGPMADVRGAFLRRDSGMRRAGEVRAEETKRKINLARKGRKGEERSWWDVEGRWRKDSVLLGVRTGLGGDGARDRAAKGRQDKEKTAWGSEERARSGHH